MKENEDRQPLDKLAVTLELDADDALCKLARIKTLLQEISDLSGSIFVTGRVIS